ncbi:LAQU0S21e00298g1_1 [Lachancea quebecensis]|uniref:LAQU0S21e00298g1_1 n=1 Tax=Lachancea quebecensis TaxID=1654605 RepID=A0A0P1KXB6_9SACH|nr:LAQU0S21e00298g1_1 [Lachancea quebecensis]
MADSVQYVSHVSFDDLTPSLIDDQARLLQKHGQEVTFANPFLHVPPQFNPLYASGAAGGGSPRASALGSPKKSCFSLDSYSRSPYGSSPNLYAESSGQDSLKLPQSDPSVDSVHSTRSSNTPVPALIPGRLPPATSPPVLKKRPQQAYEIIKDFDLINPDYVKEHQLTLLTDENTQQNSGCSHGYTTSAFANLNEVEDKVMRKDHAEANQTSKEGARRKSFAGMSLEELAALEKKYESASRTNYTIEQFDFGEQAQHFIEPDPKRAIGPSNDWPQTIYPSRPCVNHRALAITRSHHDYSDYIKEYGGNQTKGSLRTVVCCISGRKHTWSAIDWYVENMARDGDYLVIVSRIPVFEDSVKRPTPPQAHLGESYDFKSSKPKSRSLSRKSSLTEQGLMVQDVDVLARTKCNDILNYYLHRLADKTMKVTVEIIKDDSTVFALTSAIALYKPDFKIISTVSTNLHIKFRNGHVKLANFVMRHFWVPTYVVPFEFIDPALLGEKVPDRRITNNSKEDKDDAHILASIDKVIMRTLTNPFGSQSLREPSDSDGDLASVNSYFPTDPETKRKVEEFESMGYLRPAPTRRECDLNKVGSFPGSSRSSRRSSRIQFAGDHNGMYKVKSLIDTDDKDDDIVRKTKSVSSNHSRSSMKKGPMSARRTKSIDSPAGSGAKKKGGKLSGFLKKFGFGK